MQISVEGLPQQVQAGAIKKSSYFEREVPTSEVNAKIDKDENEVTNQFIKVICAYSVKPADVSMKSLETLNFFFPIVDFGPRFDSACSS